MRTHADIINQTQDQAESRKGAHALARLLHAQVGGNLVTLQTRVRGWRVQDSIPGEYWATLERLGVAQVTELAEYAERRRVGKLNPELAEQIERGFGVPAGEFLTKLPASA